MNRREYVAEVLRKYTDLEDNAYEVYARLYERGVGETDLEFVERSASLDYDDAPYGGAIYQELLKEG